MSPWDHCPSIPTSLLAWKKRRQWKYEHHVRSNEMLEIPSVWRGPILSVGDEVKGWEIKNEKKKWLLFH